MFGFDAADCSSNLVRMREQYKTSYLGIEFAVLRDSTVGLVRV